jgi:hypothetical protein
VQTCELPPAINPASARGGPRGQESGTAAGARPHAGIRAGGLASRAGGLASRARLVALAVGGFLLPWCVVLGATLPASTRAQHWSLAWVGLDGAEAVAALATAVLLTRGSARASLTAAAGSALLLVDAWFDVCTSAPGVDHTLAVVEAIFVELPLAGLAIWLAVALTRQAR